MKMQTHKKIILKNISKYIRHRAGVVAVAFGLIVPVIISGVGLSVDMAQGYLVKSRLSSALDAAALAAAASGSDDEVFVQERVDAYVTANFPDGRIGTDITAVATINGDEITVDGSAKMETSLMRIFGYDFVTVEASTTVQREVRGLEVVMVLDNTGSMSSNNNIETLRTATKSFIQILFESVSEEEYVRVGMVPYASSVNVGPYGLGFDANDNAYETAFVEPHEPDAYEDYFSDLNQYTSNDYAIDPFDLEYNRSEKGEWHGCVLAEPYPLDTEDHEGPWLMYRYDYEGHVQNGIDYSTVDYYDYYYDDDHSLNQTYDSTFAEVYNAYFGPNINCPRQPIVPLTSDEEFLATSADNMSAGGWTLGNIGAAWGFRVLSPEAPYTEGAAYDNNQWDKVALIMTDGNNLMGNIYTAYAHTSDHNLDSNDLDDRLAETCENMKAEGILVYTVVFDDGSTAGVSSDTRELYRACASETTKYHEAPSQERLEEVFEQIARELSNLYIKQ